MQRSIYLGRLIGPALLIAGLGMAVNPSGYVVIAAEILRSPALIYLGAVLGLLAGVALVLAHNVWTPDWRVIVTLLGWISIADSTAWILAPLQLRQFWLPLLTSNFALATGLVVLLVGVVLCYFGYAPARAPARRRRR